MITLACLLTGRWYALEGFLSGLEQLDYDRSKINLIFVNASENELFVEILNTWLRKQSQWKSTRLVNVDVPIIVENNDGRVSDILHLNRMSNICDMTNRGREEILKTDCKYAWIVEDDVVIPPDAAIKHLKMFTERVGATCCLAYQRFDSGDLKRVPLAWRYDIKKTFQNDDSCNEMQVAIGRAEQPADKWVEEIGSCTFSSIMILREAMAKIEFLVDYKGLNNHDCIFGLQLLENDYKMMIDWSLKVKHLHYTGEVL